MTFNYLYQYNNAPVLRQSLSLVDETPVVTISPDYERTHVIGATATNAFDNWVVRGELGYFSEHYFIGTNPFLNQGVVKSPELQYVLGLECPLGHLSEYAVIQSWQTRHAE